jgi:hypothetical protein
MEERIRQPEELPERCLKPDDDYGIWKADSDNISPLIHHPFPLPNDFSITFFQSQGNTFQG